MWVTFHSTASGSVAVQLPCYFRCGVRAAHRSALPCPLASGLPMRRLTPLRRVPVRLLRHATAAGQFQLFLAANAAPRAARAAPCTADAASCAAVTAPLPRKKSRFNRGCRCARLPTSGWLRHLADALASVGCVISQVRSPSRQPGGCVTSYSCSAGAAASRTAGTLLRNCPCSAGRCPINFTRCCHSAVYCRCSSSPPKETSVQSRVQVRSPPGIRLAAPPGRCARLGWLRHLAGALAFPATGWLRHLAAAPQMRPRLALPAHCSAIVRAALVAARSISLAAVSAQCTAVTAPLPRKKSRFNRGCRCTRPPAPVGCSTSQMRLPRLAASSRRCTRLPGTRMAASPRAAVPWMHPHFLLH